MLSLKQSEWVGALAGHTVSQEQSDGTTLPKFAEETLQTNVIRQAHFHYTHVAPFVVENLQSGHTADCE